MHTEWSSRITVWHWTAVAFSWQNISVSFLKLSHSNFYYKEAMWTWHIFATFVLLISPARSDRVRTTCEMPSVEEGDNTTLTIHFSEDLTQQQSRDFSIVHVSHSATELEMLNCFFSNGDVKCNKSPCCTWESKVTDVFRVYIHNASQQLEGKFWAYIIPADERDQMSCNFTLKASTCSTNSINATNSHVTCSNHSVVIGQSCTVICDSGHYIMQTQAYVMYTCVGKNKWSPEIPVNSCEVNSKDEKAQNLYFLFLLLSALPIVTVVVILFERRHKEKTKSNIKEDPLLPLKYISKLPEVNQHSTHMSSALNPRGSRTSQGTNHFSTNQTAKDLNAPQQSAEDYWLECIKTWYPELQSRTYFLPPFHFNRVLYDVQIVAGNQVLVPQNPQDSDVCGDRALGRVLHCLRALADDPLQKEVMMVISQLQFGKYLGEPSYAAAAALLPNPSPLPEEFLPHRYDKGDCDVLIIHRKLGLLTLEIKSVGGNFSQQEMKEQEQDDVVMKEVKKAVEQLNKSEVVLKHLTSECIATTHITKILVLPNIKSSQLLRAVNRTPDLQFFCQCFGVQNVDDAVKLCLLSDQLSDKHMSSDGNHKSHQDLRDWWQHIIKTSGPEQLMTSSLYEQLLARFCGPATTVEVHCVTAPRLNIRTLGEAVSETGERVARLVLFPQQVDILNRSPPRTFLSGPPGTGKTIVLIMQGLTWLQRGHNVHVVSTWNGSLAATIVIKHQLKETAKTSTPKPRVQRHQFDFWKDGEVKTAVRRLKSLSEGRQLCVIADEALLDYRESLFTEFCDQLIEQVPGVFIWGATVHHDVRPPCLEEVKLTTPLRSPPVVVREVMESEEIKDKEVHEYTISDFPVPTDGPPVMLIKHRHGQSGHTGRLPLDCVECGHQVSDVLTELGVGRTGDSNGPPPLKYRDVLVLCDYYPTDDRVKSFGLKTTTTSGLVRGLRDSHVPVRVVEFGDEAAIRDTALGVGDLVTVASWRDAQGLERKVVVVEKEIGVLSYFDRLLAMSRCTSQLVVIDWSWTV